MTEPQNEPYTRVPNALLDAMAELGNAEFRVVMAITRQTTGYQKTCDRLSVSQLAELTGLTARNVQAALTSLLDREIIGREPATKQGYAYFLKPYPVGTWLEDEENHIPGDTISLGDTAPYPVGTRLEEKPYPLGITQKKDSKQRERKSGHAPRAAPPDPPPKRSRKGPDPNQEHPAVLALYEKTARRPNREQAHLVAERVSDLDRWQVTITAWLRRGWSATNIGGMVDRYERLDERDEQGQTNGTNGHRPVGAGAGGTGPGSAKRHAAFDRYLAEALERYGDDADNDTS